MIRQAWSLALGAFSGGMGGICGIGGSAINLPILTTFFKMTQHQAHGTTVAATLATSLVGSYSFYKKGGGLHSVDFPAGAVMAGVAMMVAPPFARWAQTVSQRKLLLILSGLQASSIPFLAKKYHTGKPHPKISGDPREDVSFLFQSKTNPINLAVIGMLTGAASGIFGIGGGLVMVPLFSLISGHHQMAIGTSLFAMAGPTLVSFFSHLKLGNVTPKIAAALFIGSGFGVYFGSRAAMGMEEEQQIAVFSLLMVVLISRNLQIARRLWINH